MAGQDRGNMRCFEALGCGALMVSDQGRYPEGMKNEETMLLYESSDDAKNVISYALDNPDALRSIALRGKKMICERYSKTNQWIDFINLVGRI